MPSIPTSRDLLLPASILSYLFRQLLFRHGFPVYPPRLQEEASFVFPKKNVFRSPLPPDGPLLGFNWPLDTFSVKVGPFGQVPELPALFLVSRAVREVTYL